MQSIITKGGLAAACAAGLLLVPVSQSLANDARLIDRLVERGVLTEDDARDIREQSTPADPFPGMDYEPTDPIVGDDTNIRVRNFRVETQDGKHRFGIRGRLMVDYARTDFSNSRSAGKYDTVDDQRIGRGELADYGTIIRRARLGALGLMYDNWEWQLEVDFRDEEVRFANAYLAYLFDRGRLAVGHFKEPFSLESSTSSRRITFIERATPIDAYRPSRQLGIMYETLIPDYYAAVGLFGGDGVARDRDLTEGWSVAGRASMAPVMDAERNIFSHLGVSANYRQNAYERDAVDGSRSYEDVRMRSRLGTRAVDGRFIGRRDYEDVEDYFTVALEGAYGIGPFSVQGEYVIQEMNQQGDRDDGIENSGWYVQANYFLTGETRNYRAFSGDFGKTQVLRPLSAGGPGAWELAVRYAEADSWMDSPGSDAIEDGGGQAMDHVTLGLNWYPEDDIVFKFNAMWLNSEYQYVENSEGDFVSPGKRTKGWVYALRAQYEF